MPNSKITFKEVRNKTITGIAFQFLPLLTINLIFPSIKNIPGSESIVFLYAVFVFILFCLGYGLCAEAIDKYAAYKGYKNPLFILSILNIFSLAILLLLPNRNIINNRANKDPLERFSIRAIFASYLIIPFMVLAPVITILFFFMPPENVELYIQNNKNYSTFSELVTVIALAWYFFKQLKISNIDPKHILGSFEKINFKLPIELAVIKYIFGWGINPISLYGLSFVIPKYVEAQLNYEYATTPISWILFSISALIYAPIMEEIFFRGLIFQKLAIRKGIIQGLSISAILFAAIHFRFDVIPLFIMGIIASLIYFKTKQLATPIIYHFAYNLIVVVRRLFYQLFPDTDPSAKVTIIEYQHHFQDNFELYIIFLAISIPYLSYFIYKNFPRKFTVEKLPYFVNQARAN
ncbi:MAG: CPBP family intramembrane glutamic endopeptidase [Cyanobacteria bacterium P01_G01_bin.67]